MKSVCICVPRKSKNTLPSLNSNGPDERAQSRTDDSSSLAFRNASFYPTTRPYHTRFRARMSRENHAHAANTTSASDRPLLVDVRRSAKVSRARAEPCLRSLPGRKKKCALRIRAVSHRSHSANILFVNILQITWIRIRLPRTIQRELEV